MRSLQQRKQQKETFQKDDTRQHCPSHSDTLTALDTEMRWFECQPKKKKPDAIQLLTPLELRDFATQEIIGVINA